MSDFNAKQAKEIADNTMTEDARNALHTIENVAKQKRYSANIVIYNKKNVKDTIKILEARGFRVEPKERDDGSINSILVSW